MTQLLEQVKTPETLIDELIGDALSEELPLSAIIDRLVEVGKAIKALGIEEPPAEATYFHLAHDRLKASLGNIPDAGHEFAHYPLATRVYLGLKDESTV